MVSEKMYGVFEYQEKEYPFVLEGQILTIPQVPFQYKDDFKGETYIEAIQGVTNNNRRADVPAETIKDVLTRMF